jgi:hypothetical protein
MPTTDDNEPKIPLRMLHFNMVLFLTRVPLSSPHQIRGYTP